MDLATIPRFWQGYVRVREILATPLSTRSNLQSNLFQVGCGYTAPSNELSGSNTPLLLSLPVQSKLGFVMWAEEFASQTLVKWQRQEQHPHQEVPRPLCDIEDDAMESGVSVAGTEPNWWGCWSPFKVSENMFPMVGRHRSCDFLHG